MAGKVFQVDFKLGANLGSSFGKTFAGAGKSSDILNKKIKALDANQKKLTGFVTLKKELRSTEAEFKAAQVECARLSRKIKTTSKPTKKLQMQFEGAKKKAGKLKDKIQEQNISLHKLRQGLSQAGLATSNLSGQQSKLAAALGKSKIAQEKLQRIQMKQQANLNRRAGYKSKIIGVTALAVSLGGLVKAYGNVADVQGGLASLGIDAAGIDKITAAGKKFSNQWVGTTAPQFLKASYDVKSGLSNLTAGAVGEYTRTAALTAKATKADVGVMTELFVTGYGIYREQFDAFGASTIAGWQSLSAEEKDIKFGKYFSAGIAGTVKQFQTDGPKMKQSLMTLGAAGTAAGHKFSDQLAVLGQLQTVFKPAEAATKYKAFLRSAFKAGGKLDLDFVNADTGQLKKVPEILDAIKGKYGEVLSSAEKEELKTAFGTDEAVDMIDVLLKKTDELREGSDNLNQTLHGGTAITREMAEAIQRGPNAAFGVLGNRMSNLAATLGKTLAPAVSTIAAGVGGLAIYADKFIEKHPTISSGIGIIAGGATALAVAGVALGYAYTFAKGGFLGAHEAAVKFGGTLVGAKVKTIALSAKQLAGTAVTKIATAAQWALSTAVTATGLSTGALIGIVAGVAVAALLVYKYWEPIKKLFVDIGNWFANISWFDAGSKLVSSLAGGIMSSISAPVDAIGAVLGKVRDFLPFSDAKTGPLSGLTESGRKMIETFGAGASQAAPTLARPPGMKGGGGRSITLHFSQTINLPPGASAQVKEKVEQGILSGREGLKKAIQEIMANEARLSYG